MTTLETLFLDFPRRHHPLSDVALGAMLLQGCISVEVHTPWNREASIKAAQQYANHIPLTVEQLKMMLVSDTTHSKVVVIK